MNGTYFFLAVIFVGCRCCLLLGALCSEEHQREGQTTSAIWPVLRRGYSSAISAVCRRAAVPEKVLVTQLLFFRWRWLGINGVFFSRAR